MKSHLIVVSQPKACYLKSKFLCKSSPLHSNKNLSPFLHNSLHLLCSPSAESLLKFHPALPTRRKMPPNPPSSGEIQTTVEIYEGKDKRGKGPVWDFVPAETLSTKTWFMPQLIHGGISQPCRSAITHLNQIFTFLVWKLGMGWNFSPG